MKESKSTQNRRVKRSLPGLKASLCSVLLFLLGTTAVSAQTIPELESPSSLSGASTSARFMAGARVGSADFSNNFQHTDLIELQMEVAPEAAHVGTAGNIYAVIVVGGIALTLNTNNEWIAFDGTVEGLGGVLNLSALNSANNVSVTNVAELTDTSGVIANSGVVSYALYIAYDTVANPDEIYYSGLPLQFSVTVPSGDASAFQIFETSIDDPVIQARCINCHVEGGIARDAGIVFQRTGPASTLNNYQVFEDFIATRSDARDYILTKASGGDNHTGGVQLPVGGADYNNLASFLDALISGGSGSTSNPVDLFFQGVSAQPLESTLRRASMIFAGRAPTTAELSAVANGNESTLRNSIRNLMDGDGFHEFLLNGANDRLLVRGTADGTFLDGGGVFPNFLNTRVDLNLEARENGQTWNFELALLNNATDRGLKDSPLELIAHVVENEFPYSQILTADYMMLNPMANFSVDGTASFNDDEDQSEFQPGRMNRYYSFSDSTEEEFVDEIQQTRIIDPGNVFFDFPHSGVLNTQSFLFRYPTTATNRNRARARWTFFHFLDIDIERSAQRTTDPVALADTNNPTMFNENCTVCHATMDPVAGAFQLYGTEGHYRTAYNGTDSLDNFYKYPEDGSISPYQFGDTWYRDMREPGIFDQDAPSSGSSMQWLAEQIVQEPAFARAAVKFWWPAVIGSEALRLPEVEEDATYQAQLLAYDAQAATIQSLADDFSANGMNLKDVLVEMAMSLWFRADSVNTASLSTTQIDAQEIASLGSETLLTPERLSRKTRALTGYGWNSGIRFDDYTVETGLSSEYALYYGGIDSAAVTKRSTEMTPLMSTVATTHALESSCPIVLKDFIFSDGSRRLFNDISEYLTPITEGVGEFTLETNSTQQFSNQSVVIPLSTGSKVATVSLKDGFCDWDEETESCTTDTYLSVQSIEIRPPGASTGTVINALENFSTDNGCAWNDGSGSVHMAGSCQIEIPFSASVTGDHTIVANVAGVVNGTVVENAETVEVAVGVNTTGTAAASSALGATQIQEKLVDLHSQLLGKSYSVNSPEIQLAYDLYVESWQERVDSGQEGFLIWDNQEQCNWWNDAFYFEDLPLSGESHAIAYGENGYPYFELTESAANLVVKNAGDPSHAMGTWVSVVTYLLSHYHYLYE